MTGIEHSRTDCEITLNEVKARDDARVALEDAKQNGAPNSTVATLEKEYTTANATVENLRYGATPRR